MGFLYGLPPVAAAVLGNELMRAGHSFPEAAAIAIPAALAVAIALAAVATLWERWKQGPKS